MQPVESSVIPSREFSYKRESLATKKLPCREFIYTNKVPYRDQLQTSHPVESSTTDKSFYSLCNVELQVSHSEENSATNKSLCRDRGVASQKVTEGQASPPHQILKIIYDSKKRLMTQWWASQHTVLYYYSLHN